MDVKTFQLIAEIDCSIWMLEQLYAQEKRLTPLDCMIDAATGFDQAKLKAAKRLMRRIRFLRRKLAAMTDDEPDKEE